MRPEEQVKVGLGVEVGEVEMQEPCLGREHGGHLQWFEMHCHYLETLLEAPWQDEF